MRAYSPRILIIGAGPCGLGAAWRLNQIGYENWLLVESKDYAGGLAASFIDEAGFTWDIGGHVLFSHYPLFSEVVSQALGGAYFEHQREAWIWHFGQFIPYPFQNNIHRLPPDVRDECLAGLRAVATGREDSKPANFGEWIDRTFGAGIAKHFMRPYNTKIWARPPEEMAWRWVGERVSVPDLSRIEENIRLERDDVGWGPNNTFFFPREGGTGAIWRSIAAGLPSGRLRFKTSITEADLERRVCRTDGGDEIAWDALISSMPLDELAGMVGLPNKGLVSTQGHIFGIGVRGEIPDILQTKCWIYFPGGEPFYRATVFSNYSQHNAPSGHWSLMCEVSENKPSKLDVLSNRLIDAVVADGLVADRNDIVSFWHRPVAREYPVPSLDRDMLLDNLLPALTKAGVYSRGRFGGWRYEVGNMDHSFMQGVEAVEHVLEGKQEITLFYPDVVNAQSCEGRQ